jgi:hemerythrin
MEKPLQWTDSFAVGHGLIDQQHRTLIQLINDIAAAVPSNGKGTGPILKSLGRAVREHFRTENAILWEIRMGTHEGVRRSPRARTLVAAMAGSMFDEHIAEHNKLLDQFDEIVSAPLETLVEPLVAWFVDHVIKQDSRLKAIFQAML